MTDAKKKSAEQNSENKRHQQREAICRRCGRCCRQKFHIGDDILITDIPCEYLDTKTNTCTVYDQRLFKQPLCCAIDVAVANNAQPGDCPYVGGNSNYKEPMLIADHPEYREAVDAYFAKPKVNLTPNSFARQAARKRRRGK